MHNVYKHRSNRNALINLRLLHVRSENNHERYNMRHSYANIANSSVPDVIARQIFPEL